MSVDVSRNVIDEYAVYTAKRKANQLIGKAGLTRCDVEDLKQEIILDLLHRLPTYDPARGNRKGFITRVVDNKCASIIRSRKAGMRDYRLSGYSLNERLENDDGYSVERIDTISEDEYLRLMGGRSHSLAELVDICIDVRKALKSVLPAGCTLCESLAGESITDISDKLRIPKITLYNLLINLRRFFEGTEVEKKSQSLKRFAIRSGT